ncbi:hypothetical protein BGZ73_002215 [Actinomortierella ambigua]|nr:hypothetical protein BGZ73_002215 [Actinomortierella ambigua]
MNPASMVHNHPLTSPDDIRQPWPQGVFDRISFYANQRNLTTAETRERIKEEFPDLVWDERRFYNRLTEERKQIKLRDSETRVFSTMDLAAKVASLASADPTLSYKVTSSLENVLVEICEQLRIDPAGASSRVITSPPPSAGGGGGGSGGVTVGSSSLGAAMSMTSPTTASPNYPSSSASSPLSSSDYVVTYPGCVISVKNTPTQKGRPSSTSSPVVDPSLAVGLGMSPLNDRKRSLSEECFTRPGVPPPGPSAAFGMNTTHMMTSLDGSMQQLAQQQQHHQQHQQQQQHSHLAHHHHASQQHQQNQQQQLQHQCQSASFSTMQPSSLPPQPPQQSQQTSALQQAQHAAHQHSLAALDQSLVSGPTGVIVLPGSYSSSHGPHSSPGRHTLHHGHSQVQQASTHTFGQSSMGFHPTDGSSPSIESPFEGGEPHLGGHSGMAATTTTIKRIPQRRSGSSPGPGSTTGTGGNIVGGGQSHRVYTGGPYAQSVGPSSSSSSSSSMPSSVAMGAAGSTASVTAAPYSDDVFGTSTTGFPVSSEPYAYGSQPQYPTA